MAKNNYFIGLMSGTSLDGLDVALVSFSPRFTLHAARTFPFPGPWREHLRALTDGTADNLEQYGVAHHWLGQFSAQCINTLLTQQHLSPEQIIAIGSHGQTVRHRPGGDYPFTLQLGDGALIAAATHIDTIADLRSADLAHGGQGAPLAPAFHRSLFAQQGLRQAVVNLGGIANITLLDGQSEQVIGFDTGPANVLIDHWCRQHFNCHYDHNGQLGQQGKVDQALLTQLLSDPYFAQPAPKSTGREYFNGEWLQQQLTNYSLAPLDVLATLYELTAISVADALHSFAAKRVLLCGGGAYNNELRRRIDQHLPGSTSLFTTTQAGLAPDWVEAACFAWLAKAFMARQPGNLPTVTGARQSTVLGCFYPAPRKNP